MSESAFDVLLAEDSAEDAEMIVRALEGRTSGLAVRVARDGAEALDVLSHCAGSKLPRLVLLDLKMPRVDGFEVLRKMKNTERLASIPVVVVSSSAQESDVRLAYSLGANSYVVKPTDFDDLSATFGTVGHYWLHLDYGARLPR